MTDLPKITICGVPELESIEPRRFTHIVSIWDPGDEETDRYRKIRQKFMRHATCLFCNFHDISEPRPNQSAATSEQIQEILDFAMTIGPTSSVLILCWAGISRSTAIAYAILCQIAGPGTETECLAYLRKIRPQAVPNSLIVTLAEIALCREGAMFAAYEDFISRLVVSCADDEL